jgi:hypothetical protein
MRQAMRYLRICEMSSSDHDFLIMPTLSQLAADLDAGRITPCN